MAVNGSSALDSDSAGLGARSRLCISSKFPGDAGIRPILRTMGPACPQWGRACFLRSEGRGLITDRGPGAPLQGRTGTGPGSAEKGFNFLLFPRTVPTAALGGSAPTKGGCVLSQMTPQSPDCPTSELEEERRSPAVCLTCQQSLTVSGFSTPGLFLPSMPWASREARFDLCGPQDEQRLREALGG